jgi:hypothetical protein
MIAKFDYEYVNEGVLPLVETLAVRSRRNSASRLRSSTSKTQPSAMIVNLYGPRTLYAWVCRLELEWECINLHSAYTTRLVTGLPVM